ncbi:epimerase [Porphyromonas canoris]|uniref:NAD-dependent epimerase/dehydratase family protein n=1 Tax=Porphyromonas canoris TaxID=36875 RepID=UPI00051DAD25|nr:NAD(P)-dependent oxidoreductase [Porphyromonas canoris]KGL52987.1 epimerase [Porphyromonas canoris]
MNGKRVLITGATGFIGGYLVEEALRLGYEVWAAVRKSSNRSRLNSRKIHFVELDYASPTQIAHLADSLAPQGEPAWHLVIHNAGVTKVKQTEEFYRINSEQTALFADQLRQAKCPPERFVLMSSMGSYGPPPNDTEPLRSSDPCHPGTEYGKSKLLAEQYVQESGLPYTIIQPTGVYGPYDQDYLMAIKSVSKGIYVRSGLALQHLTFIFASDLARATFIAAEASEAEGNKYIVSDGKSYTDKDFGELLRKVLGKKRLLKLALPLPLVYVGCVIGQLWGGLTGSLTPLNRDKYTIFAQRNWRCDASPIFRLGFSPEYDLEEGLTATVAWARENGLLN